MAERAVVASKAPNPFILQGEQCEFSQRLYLNDLELVRQMKKSRRRYRAPKE